MNPLRTRKLRLFGKLLIDPREISCVSETRVYLDEDRNFSADEESLKAIRDYFSASSSTTKRPAKSRKGT